MNMKNSSVNKASYKKNARDVRNLLRDGIFRKKMAMKLRNVVQFTDITHARLCLAAAELRAIRLGADIDSAKITEISEEALHRAIDRLGGMTITPNVGDTIIDFVSACLILHSPLTFEEEVKVTEDLATALKIEELMIANNITTKAGKISRYKLEAPRQSGKKGGQPAKGENIHAEKERKLKRRLSTRTFVHTIFSDIQEYGVNVGMIITDRPLLLQKICLAALAVEKFSDYVAQQFSLNYKAHGFTDDLWLEDLLQCLDEMRTRVSKDGASINSV